MLWISHPDMMAYLIGAEMPRTADREISRYLAAMILVLGLLFPMLAKASVIRDTELEAGLLKVARPMAAEAGLNAGQLKIRIVISPEYNAFVMADGIIYIHSGLIMKADNMLEVAGVMAHEIGHIAAGHVHQRSAVIKEAGVASILGAVAAVALTAAGSADAAIGVMAGSTDQTKRIVLARSRQDEGVADEFAINLMESQGYSVAPMAERMRQIASQRMLPESRQSDYYLTHPGALERSAVFQDHVNSHETEPALEPAWMTTLHNRLKAKLEGWATPPRNVIVSTIGVDTPNANYKRAIAYHRLSDLDAARDAMQDLINNHPEDPYFNEFLGDILLSTGDPTAAVAAYEKSLGLLSPTINTGQIELSLGRAYMALDDPQSIEKAIAVLQKAQRNEPEWAFVRRQLGISLGRAGQIAAADLTLAEEALMTGNHDLAKQLAERVTANPDANNQQLRVANDILIQLGP